MSTKNILEFDRTSKRPKLAGPVMSYPHLPPFDRQGRRSRPKGANLPGGRGGPGPTMGKAHRCHRFGMDFGSDISGSHWAWTSKSSTWVQWHQTLNLPPQAILDSINSKPNDNIRNRKESSDKFEGEATNCDPKYQSFGDDESSQV